MVITFMHISCTQNSVPKDSNQKDKDIQSAGIWHTLKEIQNSVPN